MGRLWRGMGGDPPPHRQHGLSRSPAVSHFFWSEPSPNHGFHETRVTNHESRLLRFSRCLPASCGAAWGGYGAAWAATVPPHRQQGPYGFHESRLLRPFPFTGRQTFLLERTRPPSQAFHESRDTKHESRLLSSSRITASLPTISHHFPAFPTISRPPTPLGRSRSASRRATSAAAPAAGRQAQKRIAART